MSDIDNAGEAQPEVSVNPWDVCTQEATKSWNLDIQSLDVPPRQGRVRQLSHNLYRDL